MNIFILTGAGVSADSGVRTFRDAKTGIWGDDEILHVATKGAFEFDPERVSDFYNRRRAEVDACQPNAAHYAIAEYMAKTKNNVMLVTQNVDNYHELAAGGMHGITKMHGDLYKMYCIKCGEYYRVTSGYQHDINQACSFCGETHTIRPDVVFFEEEIHLDSAKVNKFLRKDEDGERLAYFIAIGTSGLVYPAAGFAKRAHFHSEKVYINLTDHAASHIYTQRRIGRASETVPVFFKELFEKHG